jgi:hypothetical protein
MLNRLHQSIKRLIYQRGGFDARDVDVAFTTPLRSWSEQLMRPTINFFLYDMEEAVDLRNSNTQTVRINGRAQQRMPPRRFTLRYLVSAWSSDASDEYTVLWRTLAVLLRHTPFPEELLESEVRASGVSVPTTVGRGGDTPSAFDLWSALGVDPRPALSYNLIAPLDLDITLDAPLVLQSNLRIRRPPIDADEAVSYDREIRAFGGIVRDTAGTPLSGVVVSLEGTAEQSTTDAEGRYRLRLRRNDPTQSQTLRIDINGKRRYSHLVADESDSFDIVLVVSDS